MAISDHFHPWLDAQGHAPFARTVLGAIAARPEDVAKQIACGPDPELHVQAVKKYLDAGFEQLVLVGVGPDQTGFLKFFQQELAPRLRKL